MCLQKSSGDLLFLAPFGSREPIHQHTRSLWRKCRQHFNSIVSSLTYPNPLEAPAVSQAGYRNNLGTGDSRVLAELRSK